MSYVHVLQVQPTKKGTQHLQDSTVCNEIIELTAGDKIQRNKNSSETCRTRLARESSMQFFRLSAS